MARHSESDDGRSESTSPHPTAHSHNLHPYDDMGFVDPPETSAEPNYDGDFDYEDDARERELMVADLADSNEDFTRSDEKCSGPRTGSKGASGFLNYFGPLLSWSIALMSKRCMNGDSNPWGAAACGHPHSQSVITPGLVPALGTMDNSGFYEIVT